MIDEAQSEMELLEEVAFIYPLFAKSRQFSPICKQNVTFSTASLDYMCSFLKKTLAHSRKC